MSLFSKLFGGGGKSPPRTLRTTKDFRIFVRTAIGQRLLNRACLRGSKRSRSAARPDPTSDDRADQIADAEEAEAFSIRKAKQLIDEQGDALFG